MAPRRRLLLPPLLLLSALLLAPTTTIGTAVVTILPSEQSCSAAAATGTGTALALATAVITILPSEQYCSAAAATVTGTALALATAVVTILPSEQYCSAAAATGTGTALALATAVVTILPSDQYCPTAAATGTVFADTTTVCITSVHDDSSTPTTTRGREFCATSAIAHGVGETDLKENRLVEVFFTKSQALQLFEFNCTLPAPGKKKGTGGDGERGTSMARTATVASTWIPRPLQHGLAGESSPPPPIHAFLEPEMEVNSAGCETTETPTKATAAATTTTTTWLPRPVLHAFILARGSAGPRSSHMVVVRLRRVGRAHGSLRAKVLAEIVGSVEAPHVASAHATIVIVSDEAANATNCTDATCSWRLPPLLPMAAGVYPNATTVMLVPAQLLPTTSATVHRMLPTTSGDSVIKGIVPLLLIGQNNTEIQLLPAPGPAAMSLAEADKVHRPKLSHIVLMPPEANLKVTNRNHLTRLRPEKITHRATDDTYSYAIGLVATAGVALACLIVFVLLGTYKKKSCRTVVISKTNCNMCFERIIQWRPRCCRIGYCCDCLAKAMVRRHRVVWAPEPLGEYFCPRPSSAGVIHAVGDLKSWFESLIPAGFEGFEMEELPWFVRSVESLTQENENFTVVWYNNIEDCRARTWPTRRKVSFRHLSPHRVERFGHEDLPPVIESLE